MRTFAALLLVAATAVAQNEFPDPDYDPPSLGEKVPLSSFVPSTLPIAEELVNVNTSTVNLDKAIIAFTDASGVQPALTASSDLLSQLGASNSRIAGIAQISNDDSGSVPDLIPYVNSLAYHVNHTVVNLVLKKDLAAQFCEGPTVFQAIQDTQSAATDFSNTVASKINPDFQNLVPTLVDPILEALSSASSAFADQTTTLAGCTPVSGSSTTTTGGSSTTESTTESTTVSTTASESTTTPSGSVYPTYGTSSAVPTYGTGSAVPTYGTGSAVPTYGTTGSSQPAYSSKPTSCPSRRRHRRRAEKQL